MQAIAEETNRESLAAAAPLDVLIVGAGISGISAASHLHRLCPEKTYRIVEARKDIGGTWDLFRYPGIRSDSDMYTFGFDFKPWTNPKAISDGPSIKTYLREAVDENQVSARIDFERRVLRAAWDSGSASWAVTAETADGAEVTYQARMLFMCSGYYNYEQGHIPHFEGQDEFRGQLIHPQHWPEDLDYSGKHVVVIGSGATAVTLVPAMAETAASVTMVQRSPTWVASLPARDAIANFMNAVLPASWAYRFTRWRNIHLQNILYRRARNKPRQTGEALLKRARKYLGESFDVEKHFKPDYDPWTQRLCLVPDADLFHAIRDGKASVVTGKIDRLLPAGLRMADGQEIKADIIVSATGLEMQALGGVEFTLDGVRLDPSQHFLYQGMMISDVPNLVQTFGYINASWTLRADLNSKFFCGLLGKMDEKQANTVIPRLRAGEKDMPAREMISGFNPGYMQRGLARFPRQGDHAPWVNTQNFVQDRKMLSNGPSEDGVLQFS